MRGKLVVANWKMNGLRADGEALARAVVDRLATARRDGGAPGCGVVLCPPVTLLSLVGGILAADAAGSGAAGGIALGAQDCHAAPKGAFTGDVSAPMLRDAGCRFVILGHSERRAGHGEDDGTVRAKAEAALAAGIDVILCVGETAAERDGGDAVATVTRQLAGSLPQGADAGRLILAYEPVWAIGTGRTPTPEQIGEMHGALRRALGTALAAGDGARILYGGSVKASNAAAILAVPDVDGALVGGASLDAAEFWGILLAAG